MWRTNPLAPALGRSRSGIVTQRSVRECCSSWQDFVSRRSISLGSGLSHGFFYKVVDMHFKYGG